jgi:dolichol-phosphate mannosyltransferase
MERPEGIYSRANDQAVVIVPTYNERENISRLIETVLAQDKRLEVLVVDDGSPDGTGEIVDRIITTNRRVHIHRRPKKLGLGTAYLAGFRWAIERQYDLMFEMDADFSHDPAHLPEFLRAAERADVVLGSRYREGKVTVVNWPIGRLILSYFANVYARIVTGIPVSDGTVVDVSRPPSLGFCPTGSFSIGKPSMT